MLFLPYPTWDILGPLLTKWEIACERKILTFEWTVRETLHRPGIYAQLLKVQMGNRFCLKSPDETSENFPLASLATSVQTAPLRRWVFCLRHWVFELKRRADVMCIFSSIIANFQAFVNMYIVQKHNCKRDSLCFVKSVLHRFKCNIITRNIFYFVEM